MSKASIYATSPSVSTSAMLKLFHRMKCLVEVKEPDGDQLSIYRDAGASFVLVAYRPLDEQIQENHIHVAYDKDRNFVACSLPDIEFGQINIMMDACDEWLPYGPYGGIDPGGNGPRARKSVA